MDKIAPMPLTRAEKDEVISMLDRHSIPVFGKTATVDGKPLASMNAFFEFMAEYRQKVTDQLLPWQDMSSAPRDGTWFLFLRPVTLVGSRANLPAIGLDLYVLHRHEVTPTSDGYWMTSYSNSVADHYAQGLWANLDALPLVAIWEAKEQERQRNGGAPAPLPYPLAENKGG